jgi:hypothetical protein
MVTLHNPSPAPESSQLRAKDLKNLPLLVRPGEYREEEGRDGKPWNFVECEVIVLDRSGIVQRADELRFSWARAIPQLREFTGEWVACRPVEEDQAVVLAPLTGADLDVAQRVLDELDDAF